MGIGASLFLIAVGAILKWAVDAQVSGIDLQTVGTIMMIVGVVGLVVTMVIWGTRRRTDVVHQSGVGGSRTTYVEPNDVPRP
ncbi:MAG TPA: DUF6458 family protein [Nocardioides sp.]|nr:DUF6458 family protein [Nocardioides sp.]